MIEKCEKRRFGQYTFAPAVLAAGLIVALAGGAFAANYYVNGNTGNDTNNGTSWATAYKTITKAAGMGSGSYTNYVKGDCVYMESVSTIGNGASAAAPVVYQGVPGDGAGAWPIVSGGTNYVTSGFSLTSGKTYTYQIAETGTVVAVAEAPLGTRNWRRYLSTNSADNVEATAGSYYTNGTLLYVHTFTNTSPTNVQIVACVKLSSNGRGFYVGNRNTTIQNFEIRLCQSDGIYFLSYATNAIAYSNMIYACGGSGIVPYSDNEILSYNTIFTNLQHGINLSTPANNISIHHNTIYGHTITYNCGLYGSGTGLVVSNNTVFGNNYGFWLYGNPGGSVVCNNTCTSNSTGIAVGSGAGADTVANNTVAYNGTGINLGIWSSSPNCSAYNNLVYSNGIGIYLYSNTSTNYHIFNNTLFNNGSCISERSASISSNNIIFNNIIWAVGTNNSCFNTPSSDQKSDWNDLYASNGADVKRGGTTRHSLSDWQAEIVQDLHSISVDPRVISTNLPLPDLHILLSSPCCRSATNVFQGVAAPAADMDGKTRTALVGYDQGCYRRPSIGGTSILVR